MDLKTFDLRLIKFFVKMTVEMLILANFGTGHETID